MPVASQNPFHRESLALLGPMAERQALCNVQHTRIVRHLVLDGWHERKWSASVAGVGIPSSTPADPGKPSSVEIDLTFGAVQSSADSCLALVFDYQISSVLRCREVAVNSAGTPSLVQLPQLFTPLPRDGKATGLILFKAPEGVSLTSSQLTFTLDVSADYPNYFLVDFVVENFEVWRFYNFSTSTSYSLVEGSTTSPADIRKATLANWVPGTRKITGLPAGNYKTSTRLTSLADPTRSIDFESDVVPVDAVSGSAVSHVFPVPPNISNNMDDWSVLTYLAKLRFYGFKSRLILSLADQLNLDGRLDRSGATPSPMSAPVALLSQMTHISMQNLGELGSDVRTLLGGEANVDLKKKLEFMEKQGSLGIIADPSNLALGTSFSHLQTAELREISVPFDHSAPFFISNAGSFDAMGAQNPGTDYNHLFMNPLQQDIAVSRASGQRFARSLTALAESGLVGKLKLGISVLEIGDTASALPFLLRADVGEDAQTSRSIRLPGHWAPFMDYDSSRQAFLFDSQISLKPDSHYHMGYWKHLCGETSDQLLYLATASTSGFSPGVHDLKVDALNSLRGLTELYCDSPLAVDYDDMSETLKAMARIKPDFIRKFENVRPGNGPYDKATASSVDMVNETISARRKTVLLSSSALPRVNWYFQFRYWVQANLIYLASAVDSAKAALNGLPVYAWTNLSKTNGYWNFEIYQVMRSGVLDSFLMHDEYSRSKSGSGSLFSCGFYADFAKAAARVKSRSTNPFKAGSIGFGAYLSLDRVDFKTLVYAARGGRQFEVWSTGDSLVFQTQNNGKGNSGDISYQMYAPARAVLDVLTAASPQMTGASRPNVKIAMIVPQTETIWTLPDDDALSAGFSWEFFHADGRFGGMHAMFTHLQLPVDLIFEESICDSLQWETKRPPHLEKAIDTPILQQYEVVWLNSRFIRDDAFLLLADWVEKGGVLLLGAPSSIEYLKNVPAQFHDAPVAAFNEFAELRRAGAASSREAWLTGGQLQLDTSGNGYRRRGAGVIIDLSSISALKADEYLWTLTKGSITSDLVMPEFVPPALATVSTLRALLADKLPLTSTALVPTVTVTSYDPTQPCLCEVIDLRQSPASGNGGAVIVINHRHRQFDVDAVIEAGGLRDGLIDAERELRTFIDPRTAEQKRLTQKVSVRVFDLEPRTYTVRVLPSDPLMSKIFTHPFNFFTSIEVELADYAIVTWQAWEPEPIF